MMRNLISLFSCLLMIMLIGCAPKNKAQLDTALPPEQPISGEAFDKQYPQDTRDPLRLRLVKKPVVNSQPEELKALLAMKSEGKTEDRSSLKKLRPQSIKEVARLVGLQTAIAWQYGQLINETDKYADILDQTFNFAPLVITYGDTWVLPPILSSADSSLRVENASTATSAVKTFEMLQDAQFVSVIPSWRTYLMTDNFPQPEQPHPALLPRTSDERAIWKEAVLDGWQLGLEQANELYADNIARLVRDYKGVMLFHMLATEQLLTKPQLAGSSFGTHISDRKMFIDQKVFKITKPSQFNPDSKTWKATVK